jgi:cell division protein FtsI/penicillin-binding protein 2
MFKTTTANSGVSKNSYNLRIFLLLLSMTFVIIFIALRMFNLQVLSHAYYKNMANNQHGSSQALTPTRGEIYLTSASGNHELVATNVTKNMVYAVPKEITDKKGVADKLAKLLEMERSC